MNTGDRQSFLHEIENVLTKADSTLESILDCAGWSKEYLQKKTYYVACPYDATHKVPASCLEKHAASCEWVKDGYTKEEKEKAVPSSEFFYENATTVVTIKIDKALQNHILQSRLQQFNPSTAAHAYLQEKDVPRTTDRAVTELTTEERLAIYDYVVAQGKAANVQNIFQLEDLHLMLERKLEAPEKKKSRLEILAEMRDYKRRRQSYRAKNVHITKKSYTEVMRNLIDNQMQILNPNEQDEELSNHASSSNSPTRDVKSETKTEDPPPYSAREKHTRDEFPEYERRRYSRPRERKRSNERSYDDRSSPASSRSNHKRHRSESREKRGNNSRSKRDHHSRDSGARSHKRSHKKHKHHRHRSSDED